LNDGIKIKGEWLFWLDNKLVYQDHNLVTQSGLNYQAGLFVGEVPADVPIHLAMGTGTNKALNTDTKLQMEGFRKAISSKTRQDNQVRVRTFLLAIEANGEWTEFGLFFSGTDMLDSGQLFNRIVNPAGIRKFQNQTLTVEVRVSYVAG
jgi:hypothetical protein